MRVGVVAGVMGVMCASAAQAAPAPQHPTMPALSNQGIARVAILCLVVDLSVARLRLQKALCEQVRSIATRGAPVPVAAIGFGDPIILARDTLGVLVHAAVDRGGHAPTLVLSIRPHRTDVRASTFFGATPAALPLGAGDTVSDAAIAAALDQILPWRMAAAR